MKKGRFIEASFLSFFILLAVANLIPTFVEIKEDSSYPFKGKVNLGLDLQGGLYMVLGIDFKRVYRDELGRYLRRAQSILRDEDIGSTLDKLVATEKDDPRQALQFKKTTDASMARERLREYFGGLLRLTSEGGLQLEYALSSLLKKRIEEQSVGKSIEVIRNRIDEFGVTEPEIISRGKDRIIVQLPGIKDIDRAKELIGKTAKLEFKLVDEETPPGTIRTWILRAKSEGVVFKKGMRYSEYLTRLNDFLKKDLPEGFALAFERQGNNAPRGAAEDGDVNAAVGDVPYLVEVDSRLTGEGLQDARVEIDPQRNRPYVSIDFKVAAAKTFEKITSSSIGKRMAIVLDGNVYSAPVIQSRIGGGRAQITLGSGNYNTLFQEATDLALILRAGALPVQLDFLEQRTVGPSLGQDSIETAKKAALIGLALVFCFILFYYRVSGAMAIFTLLVNVLFVLAILVAFEATLTLPGIAGLALTVGMAVDANIIIYERIREEVRKGHAHYKSVEGGFSQAFWTIIDANITTALAGICLLNFGTGPIRGFAVTLLIGICSTVYTSYFVGRLLFDFYMNRVKGQRLSI